MCHDLYTDTLRLQADGYLWRREFQGFPRTNNDDLGIQLTELPAMVGGQFVNMSWFPGLYQIRRQYHTAVDGFVIDRNLAVAIGADTVACKRVLGKTHTGKIRRQGGADKTSLAGPGNYCNLFIYNEITGYQCDR